MPHYTSTNHKLCTATSDADIILSLRRLFTAFDTANQCQTPADTRLPTEAAINKSSTTDTVPVRFKDENSLRYHRNVEMMLQCFGFVVERQRSTLIDGGTGVFVTSGTVAAGTVTSLYPGTAYVNVVYCCIHIIINQIWSGALYYAPIF